MIQCQNCRKQVEGITGPYKLHGAAMIFTPKGWTLTLNGWYCDVCKNDRLAMLFAQAIEEEENPDLSNVKEL